MTSHEQIRSSISRLPFGGSALQGVFMAQTIFKTNPIYLEELLKDCEKGDIQLPDFQRSWVWDDERIRSLIASISRAFPVGALMVLEHGGSVNFKHRAIQGAPEAAEAKIPQQLLLDGQQRITSLYQTCMRRQVVETITARRKLVRRWYYMDIKAALDANRDREEAIVGVPEERIVRSNFGKNIDLDLSSSEKEYEQLMFPLNRTFDWDAWQDGLFAYCWGNEEKKTKIKIFQDFKNEILQNFKSYQVPVIALGKDTQREAVCVVFEKVNTGGKPLDAFELVTALYAAEGFELRKDWYGDGAHKGRFAKLRVFGRHSDADFGVLEKITSTDFLQAISLLHTKRVRAQAQSAGVGDGDLPPVSATRQSLLNLQLAAYREYADKVEEGFRKAAKFLFHNRIYRMDELPYQSQVVPLAAILTQIDEHWEHAANKRKLAEWYWNGVFGELYGSAIETRFAKDIMRSRTGLTEGRDPAPSPRQICGRIV